jgi:heme/copper-type cytochrome/quinol oxidase subunit 2
MQQRPVRVEVCKEPADIIFSIHVPATGHKVKVMPERQDRGHVLEALRAAYELLLNYRA